MAPPEPEATAGHTIAGRYELAREIARGGMGTVWVATDKKLGREVALKVMRRESLEAFDDAQERFEREAKAAAALRTGHVVEVHDYGVEDGVPFIAMELLEGESLKERLEREGKMGVAECADILRQVALGLKTAHRAGLVHRDLKPSNIFLAQRDDREVVKLLDFGVVKTVLSRGSDETASGILLGTPQFMSPEQARGLRKIDRRADLWSLAVVLYLVLSGENPFDSEAEAVGDIVIRVCIDPIPSPSAINPLLGPRIDEFFDTALARDPDDRFQTVEELTEGFMMAAELSFAGLDEGSGAGAPVPSYPSLSSSLSDPSFDIAAPPSEPSFGGGISAPPPEPSGELFASGDDDDEDEDEGAEEGDFDASSLISTEIEPAPDSAPDPSLLDDPSSSGPSMAASVMDQGEADAKPSPIRRLAMIAAVAGVALTGYALFGSSKPPLETTSGSGSSASTGQPSGEPTTMTSATEPTAEPTVEPTAEPTSDPSADPSADPSSDATSAPTTQATGKPAPKPPAPKPQPSVTATAEPTADPPPPPPPPPSQGGGPPNWFPD